MGRLLQLAGLVIGTVAVLLQFAISVPAAIEAGRSFPGSIVFVLSFFTILTNIGAVLVHAASVSPSGYAWFPVFANPRMRACVAVAITMVCIVYFVVLAQLWQPAGLFWLCDVLLHYVAPVIYVAWWLGWGADGSSKWQDIAKWLAYPLIYLAYVFLRAPIAGEVPYPFLNVAANGGWSVFIASIEMTGLFLVLSVLAVLADRAIGKRRAG